MRKTRKLIQSTKKNRKKDVAEETGTHHSIDCRAACLRGSHEHDPRAHAGPVGEVVAHRHQGADDVTLAVEVGHLLGPASAVHVVQALHGSFFKFPQILDLCIVRKLASAISSIYTECSATTSNYEIVVAEEPSVERTWYRPPGF